jgi:ubiquitin-activating enzyme E1 C
MKRCPGVKITPYT